MGIAQIPAASGGLAVARFPADYNRPFQVPAGLTLQNTVTSTTTFSAGALPAQVWVVAVGGGGAGGKDGTGSGGGGGGGTCIGWVDVPSAGITATIGAGGVGNSVYVGNVGGNTYFGSLVAFGGGGGQNLNDFFNQNSNGNQWRVHGQGPGAGYGGFNSNLYTNGATEGQFLFNNQCAPFLNATTFGTGGSYFGGIKQWRNTYKHNYTGGGAGGTSVDYDIDGARGGSGLTGGGGSGQANATGGNSSRDGGLTNTYTGGTANGNGLGGGGAGLLANGSNATTNTGGAGGSGGGGGGGANAWSYTVGNGGNGCVLIYY